MDLVFLSITAANCTNIAGLVESTSNTPLPPSVFVSAHLLPGPYSGSSDLVATRQRLPRLRLSEQKTLEIIQPTKNKQQAQPGSVLTQLSFAALVWAPC